MTVVNTGQVERRGLALPALRRVGGYFASKNRYDTAWGDLLLTLFVPTGTRPGKRDFGSALHRVLFEPDVLRQQEVVERVVLQAAARWTPHIVIHEVKVQALDKRLQLWIGFGLVGEASADRRLVQLSRSGEIKTLDAQGLG
jgi:phage baseplate assembly protein W